MEISRYLLNQIHCIDLLTLCACLPDDSVDMILADLPYGTTNCSWDVVIPFEPMWAGFKRVIKPRGAIVLTATEPFATHLRISNIEQYKYDWVWVNKSQPTMFIHAKNCPMRVHEQVLIFSYGVINHASRSVQRMNYNPQMGSGKAYKTLRKKRLDRAILGARPSHRDYLSKNNGTRYPVDVLDIPHGNQHSVHPTQKPVALFEYLIKTYTQPGEIVLDPCVGSGTTAVAAKSTGRQFICGDTSAEYVKVARERLSMEWKTIKDNTDDFGDLPLFCVR